MGLPLLHTVVVVAMAQVQALAPHVWDTVSALYELRAVRKFRECC